MRVQELIRRKRAGQRLSSGPIDTLVAGITDGSISDAQIAALAMAICCNGLDNAETAALTGAMARSGTVLDWSQQVLPGPLLDKHSTGGVGDKVSLILAPLVAACGAAVPMISGRALGHTGGTLDKLDSIPGYQTAPDTALFRRTVAEVGCAIVGQTAELAPADRRFYAVRDHTATVDSIGLIVASILSKKLAAGLDGLVLVVKTGSGAVMTERDLALDLARRLVTVSADAGLPAAALISDMNQVLGDSAGNALEVAEAIAFLTNRGGSRRDPRLYELVIGLGAEMLRLGRLAEHKAQAERRLNRALDGGFAAETFARMVAALGGPPDLIERPAKYLPTAPVIRPVYPDRPGFINAVNVRALGELIGSLGGARLRPDAAIDYRVGISQVRPLNHYADAAAEQPLLLLHAADEASWQRAAHAVQAIITLGPQPTTGSDNTYELLV